MKKYRFLALLLLFPGFFFNAADIFPDNFSKSKSQNSSDTLFSADSDEKTLSGRALSDYIQNSLKSKNLDYFTQDLSPTGQDEFAQNIFIEIFSKSKNSNIDENERSVAILDFTQEDFFKNEADFLSFLEELESNDLNLDVTILLSALTKPSVPPFSRISGSFVFAENASAPDESFAVCVDFVSQPKNALHTGSSGFTSPLWLCRQMSDAFFSCDENFSFPNLISSLYRLGFIHGEKRMADFSRNEIPAVSVSFSDAQKGFSVLKNFLLSYSSKGSGQWEEHYVFIPIGKIKKSIILNESVCLAICMILAVVTLLSLCVLAFIGKQGEENKYELLKNLYMIPLTLAVSLLGLTVSQFLIRKFTENAALNPVLVFGLKIIVSMFFVSVLYALHNILRLPTDIFIYSYIIQFIAVFNILFFSLRDLMLFVPFGVEYILIFIFRKRKSLPSLIIFLILLVLPFVPYAVDILQKTDAEDFHRILFLKTSGNFSVALALFPFQIVWLKILVHLDLYNKQKKYSALKLLRNGLVSTAAVLAFCFAFMQAVYVLVYKPVKTAEEDSKILIKYDYSNICSVKITKNEFSGMNTNHIRILSEKDALRYEVKLTSLDNKVAIYDSVYAYDFVSDRFEDSKAAEEAEFVVPDFPPREITIDYAANPDSYAAVEVTAFYPSDKKNIILREKTNTFVGVKN